MKACSRWFVVFTFVCALVALHSLPLAAQSGATLEVTLEDEIGGVLVGAKLTLVQASTGQSREAVTDGKGVDVVFDPVGGSAFEQSVRCIGWEGRILVIGFASGDIPKVAANMILVKNFSVIGVVFGEHSWRYPQSSRERLLSLLPAVVDGRLKPHS